MNFYIKVHGVLFLLLYFHKVLILSPLWERMVSACPHFRSERAFETFFIGIGFFLILSMRFSFIRTLVQYYAIRKAGATP